MPQLGALPQYKLPVLQFKPTDPSSYFDRTVPEITPDTKMLSEAAASAAMAGAISDTFSKVPEAIKQGQVNYRKRKMFGEYEDLREKAKLPGKEGLDAQTALTDYTVSPDNIQIKHENPALKQMEFEYRKALLDSKKPTDNPLFAAINGETEDPSSIKSKLPADGDVGTGYVDWIKKFEGFNPRAHSDYKQTSIGYGTRAKPGETHINEQEAHNRLLGELKDHESNVDNAAAAFEYNLTPAQREALISFDFNTGAGTDVLHQGAGDIEKVKQKMAEYINVTENGQKVPSQGLKERRAKEIARMNAVQQAITNPAAAAPPVPSIPASAVPSIPASDDPNPIKATTTPSIPAAAPAAAVPPAGGNSHIKVIQRIGPDTILAEVEGRRMVVHRSTPPGGKLFEPLEGSQGKNSESIVEDLLSREGVNPEGLTTEQKFAKAREIQKRKEEGPLDRLVLARNKNPKGMTTEEKEAAIASEVPLKPAERISAIKDLRQAHEGLPSTTVLFGKGQLPGLNTVMEKLDVIKQTAGDDFSKLTPTEGKAVVFAMSKFNDPTSAVLLSEYEAAADTLGLPEKIVQKMQKIASGQSITPEQAVEIYNVIKAGYERAKSNYIADVPDILDDAVGIGINPRRIGITKKAEEWLTEAAKSQGAAAGSPAATGATGAPQANEKVRKALEWLQLNPNHPSAAGVRAKLKEMGVIQ